MKKLMISGLLAVLIVAVACKKIQEGFLSDLMRYKDNNITCVRGLTYQQSDRINTDGSTPPISFKLSNLRDMATGKAAPDSFFKEYNILVFKEGESFNIKTDSTIEELNKKREVQHVKPMIFNEVSGQLIFNKGSVNLPLGKYVFDMEATNVHGTNTFRDFATITVQDPTNDDIFTIEDNVANAFTNSNGVFTPMKNPLLTFRKISNSGARVILKMTDKNGVPFNPKAGEIIKRGDRPVFENYARFHPVIVTDTAMICDFEVAPFPLTRYHDGVTDWNHLMYYRIPETVADIEGFASGSASINPRFAFVLKMEGTYIVELKFRDAVHK
jgi:hypothetical protein